MLFKPGTADRSYIFTGMPAVWTFLFVCLPTCIVAQDPALTLEASLVKVIEQSEPSVVSIARIRKVPNEFRLREFADLNNVRFPRPEPQGPPIDPEHPDFQPNSYGAGLIVAAPRTNERLVLTNYHVVQGGAVYPEEPSEAKIQLFVRFADHRSCFGSIIAADPRSDLAVVRLDLKRADIAETDLKAIDWTTSTPVRKGQFVVMLGNPHALAHEGSASASWGMVSNLSRRPLPWTDDQSSKVMMYRLGNLIQIDGRLNYGTSGGPVLNLKGELVGLTTSLAAVEGYEKSEGFAIPFDDLSRRIIKTLIAGQEVEYGMLGITPVTVTPTQMRMLKTGLKQFSAAQVKAVSPHAPAQRAGIRDNDIILSVADVPIYSDHDLMRVVGMHAPETEVEVVGWRAEGSRLFSVKVTLAKWPVFEDERIIETSPRFPGWRGISVDYPTGRRKWLDINNTYRRAVVVTKVVTNETDPPSEIQPGLFIAEVNRVPVQTPNEFHEATKSLRGPVELRLSDGRKVVIGE